MKALPLQSCLFESRVLHERFAPKQHRFVYSLFYLAIDLDELPALSRRSALFSVNRSNLFSFREADYLPLHEPLYNPSSGSADIAGDEESSTLKERVRRFCASQGADFGPNGRVLLVTLPRVLGYLFNPVSFYYCFDQDGNAACAIAEVTNTFKEVKPFFIPASKIGTGAATFHRRLPKDFYVSPFSSLSLEFDFLLRRPAEKLAVQIDDYEHGQRVLHTALTGARVELGSARLTWFTFKYPLLTLAVIARIHWQALILWLRRVPYFAKADNATHQRNLYRPHVSIKPTVSS